MENIETTKIYSSYTEAQKRATKKYRENNRDKVNLQRKKYYEERKEKDPSFLEKKRQKAKEYYQKKKGKKEIMTDETKNDSNNESEDKSQTSDIQETKKPKRQTKKAKVKSVDTEEKITENSKESVEIPVEQKDEPKEEIKSYVSNLTTTDMRHLHFNYLINHKPFLIKYPIFYISQSVDGMINEKIYYFLKYVILKNYTPEDNVDIFIPKIYKSLKTIFACKNKRKDQILGIINTVINEKYKYLTGISLKNKNEIVGELINNIQ